MKNKTFLFISLLIILTGPGLYGTGKNDPELNPFNLNQRDTLRENQMLYNGKVWRNLYAGIKGDQFLFSSTLLPGSVTMNGKTFRNVGLRYDIYTDEILIPKNNGAVIQLNKEMVDSFSISFQNNFQFKTYRFTNVPEDIIKGLKGYVNVLVAGKTSLYVKYKKEIDILAVEDKYDLFFQTHKVYFIKDNAAYLVTGKSEFLKLMDDYKVQIKSYIKKNKLKFSKKNPESFVPLVKYYNSLKQ